MSLHEQKRAMTIADFLAFADARAGDEKWELIDGEPVMNPSPSFNHQTVVGNLIFELRSLQRGQSGWTVIPGIGVRLSEAEMPVPDVLIRPKGRLSGHFCDDMIVAFEVLSPSSRFMDLRWKRNAYPKLSSLQHYVVLAQDERAARCYDRTSSWAERRLGPGDDILDLPELDVKLSLSALYTDTDL